MSLRIALFTSPGWGTFALERLRGEGHDIVGVCAAPPAPLWRAAGSSLKRLSAALGRTSGPSFFYRDPFAAEENPYHLAARYRIPWLDPADRATPKAVEWLRQIRPDVAFVCGFSRRIPESLCAVPKLGMINFHPSLLPAHRGGTPARWVILSGDRRTGITAHQVTATVDAGDIVRAKSLEVGEAEDWGSLELRLVRLAAGLMAEIALELAQGHTLVAEPQNHALAVYERPFRQSDSVIDWEEPLAVTLRRCRAAQPKWGGIFGWQEELLCAWSVDGMAGASSMPPGAISALVPGKHMEIVCSDGLLRISRLLSARGRLVPIPDRLSSSRVIEGSACMPADAVRQRLANTESLGPSIRIAETAGSAKS